VFLENKYSRWYKNIILAAQTQERKRTKMIYFEKHHILPKSLGGNNESDNLVWLTSKEHLICHLLLCYMIDDTNKKWKMICAYHYLSDHGKIKGKRYDSLKQFFSKNHPSKGILKSEEHKRKIKESWSNERKLAMSIAHSGVNNPFFGKTHTDEYKLNASINNPAKRPEVREKMRKPKNCVNRHVICSDEKKIKISDSLKGHTQSDETKLKKKIAKQDLIWIHDSPNKPMQIKSYDIGKYSNWTLGRGPKKHW
jgi:NUMOD3 motif